MRKALTILLGLSVLTGLAAAQFSKIQPKQDGISELDAEKLGSNLPGDYVNISGDTMTGNLDMNSYSILGFFNGCSSGDGMTGIYDNGTLKCSQIQSSADPLSTVLSNGNQADNNINMTGNNITDVSWLNPNSSWKTGGSLEQSVEMDPEIESSINDPNNLSGARAVDVSGGYAYVVNQFGDSLTVVDVSDNSDPSIVGKVSDSTFIHSPLDIEVSGGRAYVAARGEYFNSCFCTNGSITVVNVSNPSNPSILSNITGKQDLGRVKSIDVSGGYAYLATSPDPDGLTIVDVSDPSNPSVKGKVSSSNDLDGASGVRVRGKYAYVSTEDSDSLTVVNVSDPSNPLVKGKYSDDQDLESATNVDLSGSYAYVTANTDNCLTVVDVSDPSNPGFEGKVCAGPISTPRGVDVAGEYAYVASKDDASLVVVDVSDPADPKIAANITDSSKLRIFDVEVSGGQAYVVDRPNNYFNIIDLTSVTSPAASIGNVETGDLDVTSDATVGGNLKVQSGLNVGPRGIKTDGKLVADTIEATGTKNFVQSVNSTHSVVYTSSESGRATVEYSEETFATPQGSFHEFPEHFSKLLASTDYQVLTTPVNSVEKVIVSEKKLDGVELKSRNPTRVDIHVRGLRKGYEEREVWRKR